MPKFSLKSARLCAADGNYGTAMANYLGILKYFPAKRPELQSEFISVLEKFCSELISRSSGASSCTESLKSANEYFSLATTIYPESFRLLNSWGDFLARRNSWEQASICFLKAVSLNPSSASCCAEARLRLQNLKTHLIDQWHFRMLNDSNRNSAYLRAISERIQDQIKDESGKKISVLDIGCGTGLLSIYSAKAGSTVVVSCEESEIMCAVATEVLAKNGMSDNVSLRHSNSADLAVEEFDEKFDLIVTELFDAGFFGENIIGAIFDAQKRLLKPETGQVIPGKAKIFVAAVEAPEIRREHFLNLNGKLAGIVGIPGKFCSQVVSCGQNFSSDSEPYNSEFLNLLKSGFRLLSEPLVVDEIDFNDRIDVQRHFEGFKNEFSVKIEKSGMLDAVVSWFQVELSPYVWLSSHPDANSCWEQAIFPVQSSEILTPENSDIRISVEIKENWFCCRILDGENQSEMPETLPISLISSFNDSLLMNCYRFFLQGLSKSLKSSVEKIRILDISDQPMFSFMTAHFFPEAEIVSCTNEHSSPEKITCFLNRLRSANEQLSSNILFCSKSELEGAEQAFSTLICQPISENSLLRQNALEDVAFYRLKFGIQSTIPSVLEVWGQVIESETLLEYTRVVSDSKTVLDLNIRDVMDLFRTAVQQDLEISTLEFGKLTEKFKMLTLNLSEEMSANSDSMPLFLQQDAQVEEIVVRPGRADAVIVWYELAHPFSEIRFNTADPGSHFKIAAYMVDSEELLVKTGDKLNIFCELERSGLTISAGKF